MQDVTEIWGWFESCDVELYSTTEDLNEDGDVICVGGKQDEVSLTEHQVGVIRAMVGRGDLKVSHVNDGDYCYKISKIMA